jgi:hypothetical protein
MLQDVGHEYTKAKVVIVSLVIKNYLTEFKNSKKKKKGKGHDGKEE